MIILQFFHHSLSSLYVTMLKYVPRIMDPGGGLNSLMTTFLGVLPHLNIPNRISVTGLSVRH